MANGAMTSAKEYVQANRTFFLFALILLVSVFGYFWWRSGFTLDFNRFFAYQGDTCNGDYDCGGGEYCDNGTCQPQQQGCVNPVPLTCQPDQDCDDDGIQGPPFGDDCDDSQCSNTDHCPVGPICGQNGCESGESCDSCSADCGQCPSFTCEENGNQCVSGQCPNGTINGGGTCQTGHCCQDDGGPTCGPVPPSQQTCAGDDDCDDDGQKNPAVAGGDDCDDSNSCPLGSCPLALCNVPAGNSPCQGNETQQNCPQDCGQPTNTCVANGNVCIPNYPGGGCPPPLVSASGNCQGNGACCRQQVANCGPVPPAQQTCAGDDDCDDDGAKNPAAAGGNDCDDGDSCVTGNCPLALCNVPAGNSPCQGNETAQNCPSDCGVAPSSCGPDPANNNIRTCDVGTETCTNCPEDCGQCPGGQHLACRAGACTLVPGGGGNTDGCTPTSTSCTSTSPNNPCAGQSGTWGNDGVVVCEIRNEFADDRCTINAGGSTRTYTVGIYNGSGGEIHSRSVMFYCPNRPAQDVCGALDNNSYPGCSFGGVNVGGATSLMDGQGGTTTYTATFDNCGHYQMDDTWGGEVNVFVVGKVIETGQSCGGPTDHLECINNACTRVSGGGNSNCSGEGSSCGGTPTHLECLNNACTRVDGGGGDDCSPEGSSCGTTPRHLECVNNTCTRVDGAGTNTCSPVGSACGATHLECVNNACTSIAGAGTPTCTMGGTECNPPPSGLRCIGTVTQANVGDVVPFSATGGTGSYSWFAPSGNPATGGGTPFSTAYSVPGFKTVTVVSGGDQATCVVTIVTPTTNALVCQPAEQNAVSGRPATVTASGGTPNYTWSAPGGDPASQRDGTSFTTTFTVAGVTPQVFPVTVTDAAGQSKVCNVTVSCVIAECPAPPEGCTYQGGNQCTCGSLVCPSNAPLVCAPITQTVDVGESARIQVGGGTAPYTWSASGGNPSTGSGSSFSVSYSSAGTRQVTVRDQANQTATCTVVVETTTDRRHTECRNNACVIVSGSGRDQCDQNSDCRPPTGPSTPALDIEKVVRNVTSNGNEEEVASANPGNTVEFTLRVSSIGSGTANNVIVRDTLPSGLTYQAGTTTVDGSPAADGIIGAGIPLGNMAPGRTITVRFRALVAPEAFFSVGTTSLVDIAYARGSNTLEVSDVAVVTVTRSGPSMNLSLTKLGRNTTRGQTGENTPVFASPTETVEFIMHVRNTSASTLTNVMVRDVLPQGITLVPGTVRVNGQPAADTLVTSGINIGSLNAGQEATITFSGRLADAASFPVGTSTRINTAYTRADSTPELLAQLPVIITRTGPPVTQVPTGPGESTLLALIISAVITLLYVGYTSTDAYRRHEADSLAGHAGKDHDLFDFKR